VKDSNVGRSFNVGLTPAAGPSGAPNHVGSSEDVSAPR